MTTIEATNGTAAGVDLKQLTVEQLRAELDRRDAALTKAQKAERKAGEDVDDALDSWRDKHDDLITRTAERDAVTTELAKRRGGK